jgi:UDP-glucose 4-epimerase
MNCLVTGGAGFIGSHLVDALLLSGHKVLAIDNLAVGKLRNIEAHNNNLNFKFIKADISDAKFMNELDEKIDWIFHLGALADIVPSIENPKDYFESNVIGSFNVASFARRKRVKKVLYAASSSAYGIPEKYPTSEDARINPQYPYALTKYLGEEIILHWSRVYKIPTISLRMFNVYGPRARTSGTYGAVFGVFLAQKLASLPFTVVGDGNQTRDFTYVSDVCRAFIAAAESDISGEIFNVGSGNTYSVNRLIGLLGGPVIHIPKRPGEPDCTFADISKITRLLKWQPQVSLEEGVKKMLECIEDWRDAPIWNPETISSATEKWFEYLSEDKIENNDKI